MDLIFSTATSETFGVGERTVDKWQAEFPKDFLLPTLDHPVVAFDGKTPVGLFEVSHNYVEDTMWLDALWVHPEHRHKKYGSAILDYLVATCQYSRIKLFAANYSEPFYEQHNFKRVLGRYYEREINE